MAKSYFGVEVPDIYEKWDRYRTETMNYEHYGNGKQFYLSWIVEETEMGKRLTEKMSRVWKLCALISSKTENFQSRREEYMKILAKELTEIVDLQKQFFDYILGPNENLDRVLQQLSQVEAGEWKIDIESLKQNPKETAKKIIATSRLFIPILNEKKYCALASIRETADEKIDIEEDYQELLEIEHNQELDAINEQVKEKIFDIARKLNPSGKYKIQSNYQSITDEIIRKIYSNEFQTEQRRISR